MHAAGIIATLLAATSVSANRLDNAERYAVCPENYDTYCCMTVVPHSVSCRNRRCKDELGWSCIYGLGKVDSIKTCLQDAAHAGRVSAYCKRPGFEYFGSVLEWTGGSFVPMLKPSDYRNWLKPGMHEPWVPSREEIRYEEADMEESLEEEEGEAAGELRKREAADGHVDMA